MQKELREITAELRKETTTKSRTVNAAYTVFVKISFDDFSQFAFELQTCAAKNLNPQRVKSTCRLFSNSRDLPSFR